LVFQWIFFCGRGELGAGGVADLQGWRLRKLGARARGPLL
jgi:hypothetical protein